MAGRYYKASILADIGKNIVKYGWPILIELVVLGFALCFYFFKWVEILNYTQGAFWNFLGGIFDWTSSSWLGLTLFEFFNSWLGGLNNAILSILLFIPIWILSLLGFLIGSIIHIAFWIVILIFVLVLIVLYYLICFVLLMSIYFVLPAASVIFCAHSRNKTTFRQRIWFLSDHQSSYFCAFKYPIADWLVRILLHCYFCSIEEIKEHEKWWIFIQYRFCKR